MRYWTRERVEDDIRWLMDIYKRTPQNKHRGPAKYPSMWWKMPIIPNRRAAPKQQQPPTDNEINYMETVLMFWSELVPNKKDWMALKQWALLKSDRAVGRYLKTSNHTAKKMRQRAADQIADALHSPSV